HATSRPARHYTRSQTAAHPSREQRCKLPTRRMPDRVEGAPPHPDHDSLRAVVYVERASQKGIVIGEGGRTIKAIGQTARGKIEVLLGARVFLELHAKVLPKWRRQLASLKRLGYAG